MDRAIHDLWAKSDGEVRSGSTAVVAFLRLEDDSGQQSFIPPDYGPLKGVVRGASYLVCKVTVPP